MLLYLKKEISKNTVGITILPIAKYLVSRQEIRPIIQDVKPQKGEKQNKDMQVQATPRPPWKPFQNGKLCPMAEPKPAYKMASLFGKGNNK